MSETMMTAAALGAGVGVGAGLGRAVLGPMPITRVALGVTSAAVRGYCRSRAREGLTGPPDEGCRREGLAVELARIKLRLELRLLEHGVRP